MVKDAKQPLTLDVIYRPVWEPESPVIDLFYAEPVFRTPDGHVSDEAPLDRQPNVEVTAARQLRFMMRVFDDLKAAHATGERARVLIPVNSLTLTFNEAASGLTDLARTLDNDMRKNVILEIFDFPKSLSLETMDDITIPMMAFFDTLYARPEQEHTDFTAFANLNYKSVTLHFANKPLGLDAGGTVLKVFNQRAQNRRLSMTVLGLATKELAGVARLHQAQGLSGPFMDQDSAVPGPIRVGEQNYMM